MNRRVSLVKRISLSIPLSLFPGRLLFASVQRERQAIKTRITKTSHDLEVLLDVFEAKLQVYDKVTRDIKVQRLNFVKFL